jgi:hypothetical protein
MTDLYLPGAVQQPLAIDHGRDKFIIPAGDVFHVAVSEASSLLKSYQQRSDGIESTGYILRDGTIQQYRPLNVECDAQLAGNSWLHDGKWYGLNSWETQGMGEGEWTDAQLASIKRIIAWKHANYGTPLVVNPGPTSPGFGYHRLFNAWNPNGHSCPGPDRVKQFNNIIVPWMRQGGNEDDMTPEQAAELAAAKAKIDHVSGQVKSANSKLDKILAALAAKP